MKINKSGVQSIVINNGVITINGKKVNTGDDKEINITITGNVDELNCDYANTITVEGVTGSVKTMSGDVKCKDVGGSVNTMSGDVRAEKINGNVSTMSGDIN